MGVEIGEVAKLLIDRLESKEENLPYETVVIKTKLKERSPQEVIIIGYTLKRH
jgi:hypothetical protein